MEKVKLKDIAELLDVSIVAVSKALNDKEGISAELRARVKETALQLGYESVVLKHKSTLIAKTVVVVLDETVLSSINMTQAFYLEFFKNISAVLQKNNYFTQLILLNGDDQSLKAAIKNSNVAGVIFLGEISRNYIIRVQNASLPIILVDFYDKNVDAHSVVTDNLSGSYELTRLLIKKGHSKIGFVGRVNATSSIRDRYMGFYKAMVKNNYGVKDEWIINDRTEKNVYIDIELPQELPTAFVCNSDRAAYGVINELKKRGKRVPEDISVVGFDNDIFALVSQPKLTTIAVNSEQMSAKAVELLLALINNVEFSNNCYAIAGKLIERDSVAKPASNQL